MNQFSILPKGLINCIIKFQSRSNLPNLAAKVTFAGAFDHDFALLLRERRSIDLTKMQYDALEIESNMMASGKLKTKFEIGNRETRMVQRPSGTLWIR
jgi:hypothetical protein